MGITRFGARLKSYATLTTLSSTKPAAAGSIAVIDGPGLAHSVFYQLCNKSGPPAVDLSYSACANEAINWLDGLRLIGFKIGAVLFDGALPPAKREVRIDRLQNYVHRLQSYKQSADRFLAFEKDLGGTLPALTGQARRSLPSPPFLVCAVVEELLASPRYSDMTFVVPGEADPYCVAAAQDAGKDAKVTIFSDDSDLLVYPLGPNTSVVSFRDLDVSVTESLATWSYERYEPADIAEQAKVSIEDLIKPAFFMAQDVHLSFEQACRKIRLGDPRKQPDFKSFAQTFEFHDELDRYKKLRHSRATLGAVPAEDSRVSELIHQLQSTASGQEGALRMYLPFLLDDPSKKTAWTVGAGLRSTAYSALLGSTTPDHVVQEYRRSGSRIASTLIESIEQAKLSEQVGSLAAHIDSVIVWASDSHGLCERDAWRYLVLQHTLSDIEADGYFLPSLDDMLSIILQDEQRTWPLIHLSAQYQAAFYSFRMLKQLVTHVVKSETREMSFLKALQERLESLPRISEFFSQSLVEESGWRAVGRDLLETLKSGEGEEERPRKKVKIRKRKNEKVGETGLERNPFAMLADE